MKYILILLFTCFELFNVYSQEDNTPYLFSEFTKGYVYYKDGRTFHVPLNYNLFNRKFFFIDNDNIKKEFSDPDKVKSLKIGERIFLPVSNKETAELIQSEPKILVQYSGTRKVKKNLTYGGKTETASVDSYSNLIYGSGDNESNTFLDKIKYKFYIEKGKRLKGFSTEKQFLKIFSNHKEQLKHYIDGNKIDFETIGEVKKLCNYALSLN